MMKCLIANAIEKEVEQKTKENNKVLIYTGLTVLAGIGAYISYKAVKNYMLKKDIEYDLHYLESIDEEVDKENLDNEDKELIEKVNEFNSRRLSLENDEIVSPDKLNHYIDQVKVDKEDIELDDDLSKEDKYDKYDE